MSDALARSGLPPREVAQVVAPPDLEVEARANAPTWSGDLAVGFAGALPALLFSGIIVATGVAERSRPASRRSASEPAPLRAAAGLVAGIGLFPQAARGRRGARADRRPRARRGGRRRRRPRRSSGAWSGSSPGTPSTARLTGRSGRWSAASRRSARRRRPRPAAGLRLSARTSRSATSSRGGCGRSRCCRPCPDDDADAHRRRRGLDRRGARRAGAHPGLGGGPDRPRRPRLRTGTTHRAAHPPARGLLSSACRARASTWPGACPREGPQGGPPRRRRRRCPPEGPT